MTPHTSLDTIRTTGCCDPFDPEPWQDKKISWDNKMFVKDHITSFLHMPLNKGQKVTRNMKLIEQAHAASKQHIMLTDENSLWGADIYIEVLKKVPGAHMAALSGIFLTKVSEGPYRHAGAWAQEMIHYVQSKGKDVMKMYFFYTTCPKCAKAYGKNYVVLLAHIT